MTTFTKGAQLARRISEPQKAAYLRSREMGQTRAMAARVAGVQEEWGRKFEQRLRDAAKKSYNPPPELPDGVRSGRTTQTTNNQSLAAAKKQGAPLKRDELRDEARRALDDFEYFRRRYFGRRCMPWAVDAVARLDKMMADDERSYVVINCPPGLGKTTLLHDWCVWETTKARWIRGLWGSANAQLAGISTKRLRNTFSAAYKLKAKERDRLIGYANDAEATLVGDFGRFRPIDGGIWQAGMFVVEQFDEENYDEKEPTWGAFGENSEEIGWRANLIVWDDLVTKATINATLDAIDRHREWFDDVAEERLEPGGLFALMGQRLGANDTYRYCLDKLITDEMDFENDDQYDIESRKPMYEHIVYPAHVEAVCQGHDNTTVQKPWHPDGSGGCLIDPHRISWKKCVTSMRDAVKWETVYQQGDSAQQEVLVQKIWIEGGVDNRTTELFPGCWDETRAINQVPLNDEGEPIVGLVNYLVVDPSPTRFWGIIHMAYDPVTKRRYVINVFRDKLQSGDFLDVKRGQYIGLAHEWVIRSREVGLPIAAMVVEANAAQRYLLQYEHVRNWMGLYGVRIIAHQTHVNKANEDFGVQTVRGIWRQGLVRLPGLSRLTMKPLVAEVTTYGSGQASDDLVMAFWFGEYNLTTLTSQTTRKPYKRQVPSWLSREGQLVG